MDWTQLLAPITDSGDVELRLRHASLEAENRLLRTQINGRVQMTHGDRRALAARGQKLGSKVLEERATVATPNTILTRHRKCVAQQCDGAQPRQTPGRPKVDPALEALWCAWRRSTAHGALSALSGP